MSYRGESSFKRHRDSYNEEPHRKSGRNEHAKVVADHYNKRENVSCEIRKNSKIYFMRNFNNWTKSVLIKKYLDKLRDGNWKMKPTVLDLGCGKGGDLLKWNKGNIQKIICTDIAATSISQCKERYELLKRRSRNGRVFGAEFIVADSGRQNLQEMLLDSKSTIDITSCQFVIHYTFESESQAHKMVQNACQNLREGGYFIGTTVNERRMLHNLKTADGNKFGNDVYSVEFTSKEKFPDFGCQYQFKLDDVVDCPEFLLKKDTLVRLCQKFGMRLIEWKTFAEFFDENSKDNENFKLVKRMSALEEFPPISGPLNSPIPSDYDHAKNECDRIAAKHPGSHPRVATLSRTEWEAASIYVVYAFVKDSNSTSKRGNSPTGESSHCCDNSPLQEEKIPMVII